MLIASMVIFALVIIAIVNLLLDVINPMSIVLHFLLFYVLVGMFVFIPAHLLLKTPSKSIPASIAVALIVGALDTWMPPYAVDINGSILYSSTIGYVGSIDYVHAMLGQYIGIGGPWLFLFTYGLLPAIELAAAVLIFGSRKFFAEVAKWI